MSFLKKTTEFSIRCPYIQYVALHWDMVNLSEGISFYFPIPFILFFFPDHLVDQNLYSVVTFENS